MAIMASQSRYTGCPTKQGYEGRILPKIDTIDEEGYWRREWVEYVEKFFEKKPYPEQRVVLAYLYQNNDVILRTRKGVGKSMLFLVLRW
jgi:hypothetical protein